MGQCGSLLICLRLSVVGFLVKSRGGGGRMERGVANNCPVFVSMRPWAVNLARSGGASPLSGAMTPWSGGGGHLHPVM